MDWIKKGILSNNQLKILALIFMTADHVAKGLAINSVFLLVLGRFAYPIFAYMIAEGCRYTKNRTKHLLLLSSLALVCQVVFSVFMHSLEMCILVTFSLSVILIYAYDNMIKKRKAFDISVFVILMLLVLFLTFVMPKLIKGFSVDYGFLGVIIPLALFMTDNRWIKLSVLAVLLVLMALLMSAQYQMFSLISIIFLLLYNGKRGKLNLKYLFYIYYPAHLVAIYLIGILIR